MTTSLEESITAWYSRNGRDLPWRRPGIAAWPVMVSEFMLQQTPVARVLPAYRNWMVRWPELLARPAREAGSDFTANAFESPQAASPNTTSPIASTMNRRRQ